MHRAVHNSGMRARNAARRSALGSAYVCISSKREYRIWVCGLLGLSEAKRTSEQSENTCAALCTHDSSMGSEHRRAATRTRSWLLKIVGSFKVQRKIPRPFQEVIQYGRATALRGREHRHGGRPKGNLQMKSGVDGKKTNWKPTGNSHCFS